MNNPTSNTTRRSVLANDEYYRLRLTSLSRGFLMSSVLNPALTDVLLLVMNIPDHQGALQNQTGMASGMTPRT